MQGLLRWVSTIDSAAERALRIIEFFDQLTRHDADLEAVTRATAVMAEATAGAEDDLHDVACAMTPAGRPVRETGKKTISRSVVHGNAVIGRVWLARPEGDTERDWDDLIMERMALAVAAAHARRPPPERSWADMTERVPAAARALWSAASALAELRDRTVGEPEHGRRTRGVPARRS
jgi:hypothetical protein